MMVRVKFAKYGPLRFTGHLDVLRFFQKAIRRAGLDVVYTHGFNPHQVMSFAAPLGVGLCSVGEYMDVEIASSDGAEDFKERLQAACPYGIDILSVKSFAGCQGAVDGLLSKKELWITKETKRSTAEVDIRSGIYDCHIDDGALVFMVDASSGGNIRPEFVTDAVLSLAGLEASKIELQTVRMETWMNTGTKEEPSFVPLDAIGEAF